VSTREHTLLRRLRDERPRRVVFLAHCILDESTRYLGGACARGCVAPILEQCMRERVGIIQMPCPEARAWGGVLKKRLLAIYGASRSHPGAWAAARAALPLWLRYTRLRYRHLAKQVAAEMADYAAAGFEIVGVVGIDGSPSCGVGVTLDPRCVDALAAIDVDRVTLPQHDRIVRSHAVAGEGIFVEELKRELRRRGLSVPFRGHDLFAELDGASAPIRW
jgi:hypothetical protein